MSAFTEPVSLVGDFVRLDPLVAADAESLALAAADGELWRLRVTVVPRPEEMARPGRWMAAGRRSSKALQTLSGKRMHPGARACLSSAQLRIASMNS